jgi:hypothetical protein
MKNSDHNKYSLIKIFSRSSSVVTYIDVGFLGVDAGYIGNLQWHYRQFLQFQSIALLLVHSLSHFSQSAVHHNTCTDSPGSSVPH